MFTYSPENISSDLTSSVILPPVNVLSDARRVASELELRHIPPRQMPSHPPGGKHVGTEPLSPRKGSPAPARSTPQLARSSQRVAVVSSVTAYASPQTPTIEKMSFHAAPLSPLRERDDQALAALFVRDDIRELEADIDHQLLRLFPEPCWEDELFEFLQEFL